MGKTPTGKSQFLHMNLDVSRIHCKYGLKLTQAISSDSVALNLVTKNAEKISEAIGSPWVVLSNGVKQPFFNNAVKACAMGGASGFLAGRAVWADIVGATDIPKALREVSIPRLEQLAEIVDTHAKPWSSW